MTGRRTILVTGAVVLALAPSVQADPIVCQKQIVRQMLKLKKVTLKANAKCFDKQNVGTIPSCPDAATNLKIQNTLNKVVAKIGLPTVCTMADLTTLGYPPDCNYESGVQGAEGLCTPLPVTTPAEFASCLACWKTAELHEYVALLYASHSLDFCGGDLSETSPNCSDLDCTTPQPLQRNLGDTAENDCQKGIGKAGIKYLVNREKILEKCALLGGTQASCLADLLIQTKLQAEEVKKMTTIKNKCGNRIPVASPQFCCRTGSGQVCSAAASRDDCTTNLMGTVIEDKFCNGGMCAPLGGGNHQLTWWENCPESATCPGTALSSINDVIDCVDASADDVASELLCLQFRGNAGADWPCPSDVEATTTTATTTTTTTT